MVNAIQNPAAAEQASAATTATVRRPRRRHTVSFKQALAGAQAARASAPKSAAGAGEAARSSATRAAAPIRPRTTPEQSTTALTQAMAREGVPDTWRPGLEFIMRKESSGQIDARNPVHSARGLFQLTRVNYHLNPNGEQSFGNGIEEAQGGIRYIKQRYGDVDRAVAHWNRKGWY